MAAYRFCRTDDIGLLVDALNHCWAPCVPDEPATSPAAFKRAIRDLHVWCSSCMVAFAGQEPIGVLIGAKRSSSTLVHRIAVHPDHRRQGHGRHLLESLSSKLAILGPPRIVAEIPEDLAPARELFGACGFSEESSLTDYVLRAAADDVSAFAATPRDAGRFVIPVTIDDLAANGLLDAADPQACWSRSSETLAATKGEISGLAIATDERIEAYVLYVQHDADADVVALRCFDEDGASRLGPLFSRLRNGGITTFRLSKVHPAEVPASLLDTLGFRAIGRHRRYGATARPEPGQGAAAR